MGLLVSPTELFSLVDALDRKCNRAGFAAHDATSPQWHANASRGQVRTAAPASSTARGTARSAGCRDAHVIEREAPHAVDETLHDTPYALRNYTVFGRFRFVVDDREDDDRGFR